jgi:DNA-nicking Smr family endonuclease
MAKKKSSKKSTSAKEFNNSPFKSLKGLSVFEKQPAQKAPEKPINPKAPETDEEGSFADEMEFLGVRALSGEGGEDHEELPGLKPEITKRTRNESDQEIFLDALGSMEKVFKDEWSEDEGKKAAPRRMKQVERGQVKPEDELDLHGMTAEEAADRVKIFLQRAVFNGLKTVRIVTGKGLHSDDGPVLRTVVERVLNHQRDQVVEWGSAPRRMGGDGALIVFLRSK